MPNYSFETVTNCFPVPSILNCPPWYASGGTPDNFHACFSNSVPTNFYGYQNPRTGLAYAGLFLRASGAGTFREYISVKLLDSLLPNKQYCVEFYIAFAENSRAAIHSIGAYFSPDSIYVTMSPLLNYSPQILSDTTICYSDTGNWVKISGKFIATGGERYITIGDFNPNYVTDSCLGINGSLTTFSYYFLDDVSVYACSDTIITDTLNISNIFTPNYDGINDLFEITGLTKGDKVQIYNRWGTLVFETESEKMFWDGYTTSGEPCSDGVYYYVVTLQSGETRKGYLTLIK